MRALSNQEMYYGLLNDDEKVKKTIIDAISPAILEKVKFWFEGKYLPEEITKKFLTKRLLSLKWVMIRNKKDKTEICLQEILDFCLEDFYEHLYNVDIVFKHLLGQSIRWGEFIFRLNQPDRKSIIKEVSSKGLYEFYLESIRLFPEDEEKCNLKLLFSIIRNKTRGYIKKFYEINIKDLDYEYGINDENGKTKRYRILESIDENDKKIIESKDDLKIQIYLQDAMAFLKEVFGDILDEDHLKIIVNYAEVFIICFKRHNISANCIKIVLLIFSGWSHTEIREVVRNENGGRYTPTGFRVKVKRCRYSFEEHCGYLKGS